jgi:hypothetical protein
MSGAADVIAQLKDDADDSDFPHVYLASTDFANMQNCFEFWGRYDPKRQ